MNEANLTAAKLMARSVVDAHPTYLVWDSITTTDATPVNIALLEVPEYYAGIIETKVTALTEDGSLFNTVIAFQGFRKDTVLTLLDYNEMLTGTPEHAGVSAIVIDTENLAVQVTGVVATVIRWTCETRLILNFATVLP
jgi:hypothetical protein